MHSLSYDSAFAMLYIKFELQDNTFHNYHLQKNRLQCITRYVVVSQ